MGDYYIFPWFFRMGRFFKTESGMRISDPTRDELRFGLFSDSLSMGQIHIGLLWEEGREVEGRRCASPLESTLDLTLCVYGTLCASQALINGLGQQETKSQEVSGTS